jgi:hypothetical protein
MFILATQVVGIVIKKLLSFFDDLSCLVNPFVTIC